MKKRVFSAALAGCMMLTMVPVTAFAAEEGVTEVAVEKYQAGVADSKLEKVSFADNANFSTITAWGSRELSDFVNDDGSLKPVVHYDAFSGGSTNADMILKNGYYLPLKLTIPNVKEGTKITFKGFDREDPSDPFSAPKDIEKTINASEATDSLFDWQTGESNENGVTTILFQVARLDGEMKRESIDVVVEDPDGNVKNLSYALSQVKLADSKYKLADELKICTDAKTKFPIIIPETGTETPVASGDQKTADKFYDASAGVVKKQDDGNYYLPFQVEVDADTNGVTDAKLVVRTYNTNGKVTDTDLTVATGDKGKKNFLVKIADGKLFLDKIEVLVCPEGVSSSHTPGDRLYKKLTYDLSNIKLEQDSITIKARLPKVNEVVSDNGMVDYLGYRENIRAVKSMEMEDGVLNIVVDLRSLATTSASNAELPVLFTMTSDGKSIVKAQPTVTSFGGVSKVDYCVLVDLRAHTAGTEFVVNISDNKGSTVGQKVKIVNASAAPVLKDSSVAIDGKTLAGEGLTAGPTALTAADIKNMFDENGGSVVVTNIKDGNKVGTGTLITLKDEDGKTVYTLTVIVKGDVTGEGYAHLGQVVAAGRAFVGADTLEGEFLTAGDINGNGEIDLGDIVGIGQMAVGTN